MLSIPNGDPVRVLQSIELSVDHIQDRATLCLAALLDRRTTVDQDHNVAHAVEAIIKATIEVRRTLKQQLAKLRAAGEAHAA